ncbi:hypothetical protein Pmar_PMAR024860 [Perkinsus marinus ATCC 50983]|uniref:Uncharacterized protein n=1 Tax=Perkinsus marinus (strain ATCC 50983 / TXsc) TaxID=423536 RepID=C5LH21_PERM5|nr:hypothetical protein Pmar_PMAR024860 [Perkinsus marinus ATCC 50983]EER03992.1 hypothetical protein Pmar_PMAR024860 [Perkinsus marinus ATCC 50983]|eukprot:XP_002772176.1 hypothetical protein Pmar_PMAR024860 [Perkinsus marinus ATCC 50983]
MLVDFLWDKDDLGMEELRTILKQFVGRRDVSIRVVEPPVTIPPVDDIFCRGTSLIGLRSKMRMQGRASMRHLISLETVVHGRSGAITMRPTFTKAWGFPLRTSCHYDEVRDRLFILYEGAPQLVIVDLPKRRVARNCIIRGQLPSHRYQLNSSRPTMITNSQGELFFAWRSDGLFTIPTCTIFRMDLGPHYDATSCLALAIRQYLPASLVLNRFLKAPQVVDQPRVETVHRENHSLIIRELMGPSYSEILHICTARIPNGYTVACMYPIAPRVYLCSLRLDRGCDQAALLVDNSLFLCSLGINPRLMRDEDWRSVAVVHDRIYLLIRHHLVVLALETC